MSSATRMTSGLRPASAISGGDSQPDAENESALFDVRIRRPGGALNRDIDGRAVARERRAQTEGEALLRHFLAVNSERQGSNPSTQPHGNDSLHESGAARFQSTTDIPSIKCLDPGRRKRA